MEVLVIGAGVIGATTAAHLAQRGAQVTLVERDWPGAGTSSTSYAWVNANGKEPESYFELNRLGIEAHHSLATHGSWLQSGGHVEIASDPSHAGDLRKRADRLLAAGYEVQQLSSARAVELLPDVVVPKSPELIAYFPREAHCYPLPYLAYMLSLASDAGAIVRKQTKVVGFTPSDGGAEVHLNDGSSLHADTVVSAVGRWTSEVAELAGTSIPMCHFTEPGDVTMGYLLETTSLPVRLNRVLTSSRLNVRPLGGGKLLIQALDLDATAAPTEKPANDSPLAETFLDRLRAVLRNAEGAAISNVIVGQRAMPADGLAIVGRAQDAPWLYVVATHSGVTLAPFIGEAVAAEIATGKDDHRFADYRPSRFTDGATIGAPRTPRKPGEQ